MKKTLVAALLALATVGAYAQGTVNFANVGGGVNAPVSGPNGLLGAGFSAQLYAGASADSLAAVGAPANFLANGLFSGGARTITGVAGGATAWIRVDAMSADGSLTGSSNVFSVTAGGAGTPPSPPSSLTGLQSFSVSAAGPVIPEPSTVALALLGGIAFLFARRK